MDTGRVKSPALASRRSSAYTSSWRLTVSNVEQLLREVEGLPPDYLPQIEETEYEEYPPQDDDSEFEIKAQLAGGFSPELFGKGEICGDIIGPFYEAWADSDALKGSH